MAFQKFMLLYTTCLVICLCLQHNGVTAQTGLFCTKVNTTSPLPDLPESFQTRIEMNIVSSNVTYEMEEWYLKSEDTGNGRIRLTKGGEVEDYIFNYKTREIYVIYKGIECLLVNMSDNTDVNLLFGEKINGQHIASASSLLRFAEKYGMEYRGNNQSMRGIQVDYWYSCQVWPDRNAEFSVDWYFTTRDWESPYERQIPVRAVVKGIITAPNKPRRNFHIEYNFYQFRMTLMESDRIFDTPKGVYCENRVNTKPMPKLLPIMIYTQEILLADPELTSVRYGKVSYDQPQKLVKYEYRELNSFMLPPFYNLGTLSVIQDFSTGVSYFVDEVLGNCTDQPIGNEFFEMDQKDIEIKNKPGWHLIELRNPNDLFKIDDSYQYTGSKLSRGIPVDIYISRRTDYQVKAFPGFNFTFEYHIIDPNVIEEIIGKDKVDFGQSVPMELKISNYLQVGDIIDPGFTHQERYNFFNFDSSDSSSDSESVWDSILPYEMDVTQCYKKEERMNLIIWFLNVEGLWETFLSKEKSVFIRKVTEKLLTSQAKLVNPIRIQKPRVDYDDVFIYFVFTLLEPPHPKAQFVKLKNTNKTVERVEVKSNVNSEEECLRECNKQLINECNSVAFCPSNSREKCLMSSSFNKETNNPSPSTPCSVFIRPVNTTRKDYLELSNDVAFAELADLVNNGDLKIDLEINDNGNIKNVTLAAVDIEEFETRPELDHPLTGRHLAQFGPPMQKKGMRPTVSLEDNISADECAIACLDSSNIACKAITYCYTYGACYLHDFSPKDKPDEVVDRAGCNLYTVNELAKFDKENGISRVLGLESKLTFVADEIECAQTCLADNNCRSFDLCKVDSLPGTLQMCYISPSHKTDSISKVNNTINCTHYSRAFSFDFSKQLTLTDPDLKNLNAFVGVNSDRCAKICVENYGSKCMGYYQCDEYSNVQAQCSILTTNNTKVSTNGANKARQCSYYNRVYDINGQTYKAPNQNDNRGGMAMMSFVLLTVGVLVLGLLIGALIIILFLKSRGHFSGNATPELHMRFQNAEE